jgi:hypothetical protein
MCSLFCTKGTQGYATKEEVVGWCTLPSTYKGTKNAKEGCLVRASVHIVHEL